MRSSRYTEDQIVKALELYVDYGPRKASAMLADTETPVSPTTLSRWAKLRGIATESVMNNEAAIYASVISRKRSAEETKLILTERLSTIAELAAEREIILLQSPNVPLRDAVTSRTKAVHDLRLLQGESTEVTTTHVSDIDIEQLQERLETRNAYHGV